MYGEELIVYKFGGTALLEEEKVLDVVKLGLLEHQKIIVVVSAIGRTLSPYSTDALYDMSRYVSSKESYRLVSCGEIISSVIVSNLFRKNGINAISLSIYEMNLIFDDGFKMNDSIEKYLKEYDVVIVPGFVGLKDNEPVLLPRGGSNITASYLASYFKSNLVIFTDVDGIYYTDPRIDKNAKRIRVASYDTLKEIVKNNQKLFPNMGIKYLEESNVVVLIRSLDNKNGTIVKKI